jgi:two-component system, sporulation sensor kinase D
LSFSQRLKLYSKTLLIYIMVTLVPSLIISYFFAHQQVKDVENHDKNRAQEFANFHAMNIENFLGETVGRLEMLATSIKLQHSNLINIETILKEMQGKDPRFSGFYWASPSGNLLISTNPTTSVINVGDRPYFQQALKTEQTSFSEAHIGRVTGRFIITIATPVVEHGQILGVVLASLRMDEIEASIKGLLKNEAIVVTDPEEQTLIKVGTLTSKESSMKSNRKITQVPWTITASVQSEADLVFRNSFLLYLMIVLTISNILLLLVHYLHLRKKLEKEKEQTEIQKLELIGNLAASTAHEIRNPLTGIKGLVKLLSEESQDKKAQSYYDVIQLEIDRINAIVSELLVLGKPTAYSLKTYNTNEIIKEIEPIIQSEANFMNVQLTIGYIEEDLLISCVKDHVKQVILNLVKNSLQAMPHGGQLSISLEKDTGACLIRVKDNGVGMQRDQLQQAFNPFYTAKKDGSGLGLTVCKRIIETYGGKIVIDSTPNLGTQVEITIPITNE